VSDLQSAVEARGVTRLCHFTPARNLCQMLKTGTGVLSTARLKGSERSVFSPTDLLRLDGYPGHVCCSLEYPNPYYFKVARAAEPSFPDWPILLIEPSLTWTRDCLFCASNASSRSDKAGGSAGFEKMFASSTIGGGGRRFERWLSFPAWQPTDLQAEVLVPDQIPLSALRGVAFESLDQCARLLVALGMAGVPTERIEALPLVVAPGFYKRDGLISALRRGIRVEEVSYTSEMVLR
jgi:ssDNA thymidine ADP-ribosyltransferase, DarT